jgi:hypothetical protein
MACTSKLSLNFDPAAEPILRPTVEGSNELDPGKAILMLDAPTDQIAGSFFEASLFLRAEHRS